MSERPILSSRLVKETLHQARITKLSMIVDPPNQSIKAVNERVSQFLSTGGSAVIVGGSGKINEDVFDETINVVRENAFKSKTPVWILPGHVTQIPKSSDGISGVFNYEYILGGRGSFESAYPQVAREYVAETLAKRQIRSISTLYILCGDPNASVSQVSGITPLDLSVLQDQQKLIDETEFWLQGKMDCVFFESGSNSTEPVDSSVVLKVRRLIDDITPNTTLIVSGGITRPEQVGTYSGIADFVNIGGHFERNGTGDTHKFIQAL